VVTDFVLHAMIFDTTFCQPKRPELSQFPAPEGENNPYKKSRHQDKVVTTPPKAAVAPHRS